MADAGAVASPASPSGATQDPSSGQTGQQSNSLSAITDPSIRRSLLLQALVARQRPGPLGGGPKGSPISGTPASPASASTLSSPSIPLPDVPLAPLVNSLPGAAAAKLGGGGPGVRGGESIPLGLSLEEGGAALQEALMTGNWDQVVEGLDAAAAEEGESATHWLANSAGPVTPHDLDHAQKQLEAWAQAAKANNQTHSREQHSQHSYHPQHHTSPAPFPWAALYPHAAPPPLGSSGYYNPSTPSTRSHSFSEHPAPVSPPNGSENSPASGGGAKKGKSSGGKKGKAAAKAAAAGGTEPAGPVEAELTAAEEEARAKAQSLMTPEEIEEDKRRRNTEASARFRAKKKQRDAELSQTTAQLRQRVAELEQETQALKTENRWLRELISEKTGRDLDPRLLDLLRATQAQPMDDR